MVKMPKGLVLDGGGVFGIGQANIVAKANIDQFDFFVGTSIGAAIAAVLAMKYDKTVLPEFFHDRMPEIFAGSWWRSHNVFSPRYKDDGLNKALQYLFAGVSLGSVHKPLFATAANLKATSLKVFNSTESSDASWPLWEVIRCSTAAESYFKPWNGYGDGGVFANNPSMVAVAAACKTLNYNIEDIELCSIGTGYVADNKYTNDKWSLAHWGVWLIKALLSGASSSMHEYFVRSLPIKKYERIEFIRDKKWNMDDPKDMLKAEEAWKDGISDGI
jgi:patatin-like phospholipase/acyl hydrolase